jgi:transposase InsO family protein
VAAGGCIASRALQQQHELNGFVESFNGKRRDEMLNRKWFRSRAEAKVLIERWRQFYNERRRP